MATRLLTPCCGILELLLPSSWLSLNTLSPFREEFILKKEMKQEKNSQYQEWIGPEKLCAARLNSQEWKQKDRIDES